MTANESPPFEIAPRLKNERGEVRTAGFEIEYTGVSLREACELIRTYGDDMVAVLLDIDLPGSVLDGILLTRILRRKVPAQALPPFARNLPSLDVPIVLVTERPESYSEVELRRYGGDRVMAKPVDIGRVTLAVTEWHLRR